MKKEQCYGDLTKLNIPFTEPSYDTYENEKLPDNLLSCGNYKNFSPTRNEITEILAPASVNTYKQAVYGGANAIYFGYGEYNARAGAENFDSIKEVVDFCHFYNVKAYLALNICFFDEELEKVINIIREAEAAKIDAFIISDLSLIPYIRKYSVAPIHASTQLGVHNRWGIDFIKQFGFSRAILSRETNFENITDITNYTDMPIEVFVHGALCIGFSGGCLLSSMLTGNSGNRGRCNQLCRQYYKCKFNGKQVHEGYLLSAKDNCFCKDVQRLIDAGVSSLKIEGRLKRPEYIEGVTRYYSDIKLNKRREISETDVKKLFNRGDFTDGYFSDTNVIYENLPNHIGVYVGKITHLINNYTAFVASKTPMFEKNGYKIIRNYKDMGAGVATGEVKNGFSVVKANFPLKVGDIVRWTSDNELADRVLSAKLRKNVPIAIKIIAGQKPIIKLNIKGHLYVYESSIIASAAINQPLTEKDVISLFEGSCLREVRFIVTKIELYNVFLTKAQQNLLRREVLDCVWTYLLAYYERSENLYTLKDLPKIQSEKILGDFAEIDCTEKFDLVCNNIKNIVYSPSVFTLAKSKDFYKKTKREDNKIFVKLPIYIDTTREDFFVEIIKVFDGVLANNIGAVQIAHILGKYVVCGQNMNITNTKNWLINNTNQYIVSTELNYSQLKKFHFPLVYAYGNLPLMYLNYCPRRNIGKECGKCGGNISYCDTQGEYPITTQKFSGYCEHTLRNGILTDIGTGYKKIYRYFDFSLAKLEEITQTIENYYIVDDYKPNGTNKLHLTRGVK